MALDARLAELAARRWMEWRRVLTEEQAVPILVIAAAPGLGPGVASYRFGCAPEVRLDLPRLLREAADAIERTPQIGGPVILTPPSGSAEYGKS